MKPFAVFAFYWETGLKGIPLDPFFHIVGGCSNHSTVGLNTLTQLGIETPNYPSYETWVQYGKPVYRIKSTI